MKISIDESGNVSLDTAYDTSGIDTIHTKMDSILSQLKTFDATQIEDMAETLNELYPKMVSFEQFLEEWQDVLSEVKL